MKKSWLAWLLAMLWATTGLVVAGAADDAVT